MAEIYRDRGLSPRLAQQVAEELTAKDVIRAHARDELVRCTKVCVASQAQSKPQQLSSAPLQLCFDKTPAAHHARHVTAPLTVAAPLRCANTHTSIMCPEC